MNPVAIEEDLELTFAENPVCEDDHLAEPGDIVPPCSVLAVARLRWECSKDMILICQSLVDWIVRPPQAHCASCNKSECLSVTFL